MKKFNLKLITPLILTFILQGCMPDSLTKFKKDPPKKAAAAPVATVVDAGGTKLVFTPPTYLYYGSEEDSEFKLEVGQEALVSMTADGSLNDITVQQNFIKGCALVTTGNVQTRTLPAGLTLDPNTCIIKGTPTANKSVVTPFCSNPAIVDQATCESTPLVWDSASETCSRLDFKYSSQSDCESSMNIWYSTGSIVPYLVELTFNDADGIIYNIFATAYIGTYSPIANFKYTQTDKLLLPIGTTAATYAAITPIRNTPATVTTASYTSSQIISFSSGLVYGVINFVDQGQNVIGIKKLEKIIVTNGSAFSAGEIISTADGKVGKIFKKDSNNGNILFVENISPDEKYFTKNDLIDDVNPFVTAATTISSIEGYILDSSSDATADNDLQYYSPKMGLASTPINSYLVNSTSNIKDLTPMNPPTVNNGTEFTVSPKLPAGLSIDKTTGIISGKFTSAVTPTMYTITATNPLGSVATTTWLAASDAPSDLSLSNKQIITVSNTAMFKEGEILLKPLVPPLTQSVKGKIVKILNNYQLAVETFNGSFGEGSSLDTGSVYLAEKAYVVPKNSCVNTNYADQATCEAANYIWSTGDISYNVALTIDATAKYIAGDYVNSTAGDGIGAKGLVAGVFTAAHDVLYVKFITQTATGVSSVKSFYEGDTLENLDPLDVTPVPKIEYVENESLKLTLADSTGFTLGSDIISSGSTGAYTHKVGTAGVNGIIYVSDISKKAGATPLHGNALTFDTIYNNESGAPIIAAPTSTTINKVTHDSLFIIERGAITSIPASLSSSAGAIFTIVPTLPSGLTLDSKTGTISGTPTVAMPRKDYTLTAQNFIGSEKFVFSLEVRDYFQLTDNTGAPSTLLHKVGDSQTTRNCRVNSNDILNTSPNPKALDIRCFLDIEEADLYLNKLKLTASTGPGFCEYIQYAPFYFNQYSPLQSAGVTSKYQTRTTVSIGCLSSGTIPSAEFCEGNYTDVANTSAPNCDEGYIEYIEKTYSLDGGGVCNVLDSTVTRRVNCGGTASNCIAGPIRDILTKPQIDNGNRSLIYGSSGGLTQAWTHTSPVDVDDITNLRVANHTIANQCYTSSADATEWTKALSLQNIGAQPFARVNPFYVVNCLNAAKQIKARIRLTVREWNKDFRIDDGIDNQDYVAPAANMDIAGTDIFSDPYNNYDDWDNDHSSAGATPGYNGAAAPICGKQVAGSCTLVSWPQTPADCLAIGGTSGGGSCSNATFVTQTTCEAPGVCDNVTYTTKTTCEGNGAIWTSDHTWTPSNCAGISNQYQCVLQGGTWTGDEDYKFPNGNI